MKKRVLVVDKGRGKANYPLVHAWVKTKKTKNVLVIVLVAL